MARETKVGLLAGLAFIVCFAVILANRGREVQTPLHRSYVVDAGQAASESQSRSTRRQAIRRDSSAGGSSKQGPGNPATNSQTTPAFTSGNAASITDGPQLGSAPEPSSGGSVALRLPNRGSHSSEGQARHGAGTQSPIVAGHPSTMKAGRGIQPSAHPAGSTGARRSSTTALQQKLATLEMMKAGGGSVVGVRSGSSDPGPVVKRASASLPSVAGASGSNRPRSARATYEVNPGDTLSRIAKRHYGTASTHVINAIFDANRAQLSSPDVLKVGMKLALPQLKNQPIRVARNPEALPQRKSTTDPNMTSPKSVSPSRRWRWYQIKKNDRYISIAREQLGDGARWQEIFELNKEKFPDPSRIRDGVKIKLPVMTVADGRKRMP